MRLQGTKALDRKLKKLVRQVDDRTVEAALEKAAEPMAAQAEARAPRRTGELAESVEVTRTGDREVAVQAKDFKAWWTEMGTVGQPPRPFLLPAFHAHRRKAVETFRRRIKRVVERGL